MKINNKYFLAYLGTQLIIPVTENHQSEVFPASGVEVVEFDNQDEAESYIKRNNLVYEPATED